jgi:imidazole glycerol-phosphate synthase subunit HisH
MRVLLIDSPVANVANIERALKAAGADVVRSADPAGIATCDKVVLPGVGTFGSAIDWLERNGIDRALGDQQSRGGALLGICVGHQLLFESSSEMGHRRGLALARGSVSRFEGELPVPQVGWNRVDADPTSILFSGLDDGADFYFVNSYRSTDAEATVARSEYGETFTAAIERGRLYGVQFHPEKSSSAGLQVLRNFVERG